VGDSFGQTSVDTLYFSVTDPMDYSAQMVFNYPNPFSESTYFLFKLTDRAKVHLDIFTLSGRRIRTINQTCQAGEAWVYWEGRDGTGEPIANGVYLYVARVAFSGIDRPPIDLRGKVVKID
jgi:hypothetical protein